MKVLILGAGGIGRATATALLDRGADVTIGSRSGTPHGLDGVGSVKVDAADAAALTRSAAGYGVLVNALNPASYTNWATDWPPMANAILTAAGASGAGLVTISNLYAYGPHRGPLTEDLPLAAVGKGTVRGQMWRDALKAHQAGRVRVTELRASDYFGADARAGMSYVNTYVLRPAVAGKPIRLMFGDPDALHSWTYLADIGELAATLATDDRSWGRAWHVPTAAPRSIRTLASEVGTLVGRPAVPVSLLPGIVRGALRVSPLIRSLDDTRYQFDEDFVVDSTAAQSTFGLSPTDFGVALRATVDALSRRDGLSAAA